MSKGLKGSIFDIQTFSAYDGPGVRTVVFFQGCNMKCAWCHNPESWASDPPPVFLSEKCISCSACAGLCRAREIDGVPDASICKRCMRCCDVCYAGALIRPLRKMTASELWKLLSVDKPYFDSSGGGITFSGGECMLQADFLAEIVNICLENKVHTAIDTAGHVPYEWLKMVSPDLFLYDIKASSPLRHKELTGVDGILVWENLRRLTEDGFELIVRVPCVPGANLDELPEIGARLRELGIEKIELLPYHSLGAGKSKAYGVGTLIYTVPSEEEMQQARKALFITERNYQTYETG
ncbi:MAG: glycyl-radical enzyme activating protein [Oscillospiraceae bacterium]|nr:glycyl-radical enzyme activating protein [Oscillospiraceae bacterium]MCL2278358.1 glycyl-radical enzyme activating protein [Oscillospiraceae bacterium]